MKNARTFYKNLYSVIATLIIAFAFGQGIQAQSTDGNESLELLLPRLDLEGDGLKEMSDLSNNPEQAAAKLLEYFKERTTVKHPVHEEGALSILEKELKYANDALNHVFVGQPAYPSHFCGDDIDWSFSPVPDKEWVWQLNRMYFWNAMGKVYTQTKDERFAKEWGLQLIDWVKKNPNDKDHKYAWRSIETGIRGHSWTALYQRFIGSEHFTSDVLISFLNSCYDHAEFLMTKYRSNSNWGLMEAEGMAYIAMTFPEFKNSLKWRTEALRRLNNEIDIQVYADGHQRELAMGYHLGCIRWFMRTYDLAKLNGLDSAFPKSYLDKIEKMSEVPMKLCMPDGTNVPFGDSWMGTPGQHKDRLMEWSKFFDREDFLYMAAEGKQGKQPSATAYALEESGLYSMRSGWDKEAICLVLKCGPDGGGHCQPDNGTFDLYAGNRNLMPDAGSYIYSGNPEGRRWFRQSSVHQTLTLNGENIQYNPKLLQWEPREDLDILVVENQSYPNLKHRRAVFFVDKQYFVIVDEAVGDGVGDVDIHFQLAPGEMIIDETKLTARSDFKNGWNVLVQTSRQKGIELSEEEGQVSFVYTKKEPRPAFRYRLNKGSAEKNIRFVTLVAPYESEAPEVGIKIIGKPVIGSSKLSLEVVQDGKSKTIAYDLNK
ncbi:MAG: alginate lyase family protein [Cyclobacteriaceae bacterium]